VITHLDLDHAGGMVDFPNARVHLHAREHAAAMARSHFKERERYLKTHWSHGPKWEVYSEDGDTWRGLPAIVKLRGVEADVGLLPLHGHTRGHSGVLAKAPGSAPADDRWLVHAGDAYFHHGTLDGTGTPLGFAMFERATQMDSSKRRASLGALRQLRHNYRDVDVFSAHDPIELEALRARA
jgi:glyoxylase-like metal-dependent hydrolase (beta-lactamase superfamily II)